MEQELLNFKELEALKNQLLENNKEYQLLIDETLKPEIQNLKDEINRLKNIETDLKLNVENVQAELGDEKVKNNNLRLKLITYNN